MKSFRNPKYLERYEDVVFDLEQALETEPANNAPQTRVNLRFVADNTGEVTPFDWYNARLSMDFKVALLAGGNITATDHNGTVNGSNTFIEKLSIKANGKEVYSCNYANHSVNIKNLLEYNPSYSKSIATNEFYFLDTSRNAEEAEFTKRRVTHRQKALEDKLLPNTKIELNIEIEKDSTLVWQAGANCRIIITRLQLFVPRLSFNSERQKLYMEEYLKPYKWTYLNEVIERSGALTQRTGNFRITNAISKPRHVFVFIINNANIESQTANPFLYNTFSVSTDPRTLDRCYLEVGNGNEYPDLHYKPSSDLSRVYSVYANNDYQGGTLLNRSNISNLFPFVYFDLTKQKMDIKDGVTKLAFHYELSGNAATDYNVYALVLHEREAELEQKGGKLLLRA